MRSQDPAIHADSQAKHPDDYAKYKYPPYDEGVKKDIFIKWPKEYRNTVPALSVTPAGAMLGKVSDQLLASIH